MTEKYARKLRRYILSDTDRSHQLLANNTTLISVCIHNLTDPTARTNHKQKILFL